MNALIRPVGTMLNVVYIGSRHGNIADTRDYPV